MFKYATLNNIAEAGLARFQKARDQKNRYIHTFLRRTGL